LFPSVGPNFCFKKPLRPEFAKSALPQENYHPAWPKYWQNCPPSGPGFHGPPKFFFGTCFFFFFPPPQAAFFFGFFFWCKQTSPTDPGFVFFFCGFLFCFFFFFVFFFFWAVRAKRFSFFFPLTGPYAVGAVFSPFPAFFVCLFFVCPLLFFSFLPLESPRRFFSARGIKQFFLFFFVYQPVVFFFFSGMNPTPRSPPPNWPGNSEFFAFQFHRLFPQPNKKHLSPGSPERRKKNLVVNLKTFFRPRSKKFLLRAPKPPDESFLFLFFFPPSGFFFVGGGASDFFPEKCTPFPAWNHKSVSNFEPY